jgi:hypothetical protein
MVHFFVEIRDTRFGVDVAVTRLSNRTVYLESDEYYIFSIRNLGRLVSGELTFLRVADVLCVRRVRLVAGNVLAIHVSEDLVHGVSVTIQDRIHALLFYNWLLTHGDDFVDIAETLYENYRR